MIYNNELEMLQDDLLTKQMSRVEVCKILDGILLKVGIDTVINSWNPLLGESIHKIQLQHE